MSGSPFGAPHPGLALGVLATLFGETTRLLALDIAAAAQGWFELPAMVPRGLESYLEFY